MYKDIIDQFSINKGDAIWFSSDLTHLALMHRDITGARFEPAQLIERLKDAVGSRGTILIPTFNYEFSNKGRYSYTESKGTTGVLGNTAIRKCGFIRTKHPLHSFAVWGKDKELLYSMDNKHSFGEDSPFGYCNRQNVRQIMCGYDWRALTFVHYAETICKVPYRFTKEFTGSYTLPDGTTEIRTYEYAARYLEVGTSEHFERIWKVFEEKGIAKSYLFRGTIKSYSVELGVCFPIICDDIIENQCKNLYDFDVDRGKLFETYGKNENISFRLS